MRYKDIKEYKKISDIGLNKLPDIDKLHILPSSGFSSNLGNHHVYALDTSSEIFFGVEYTGKIVAGLILSKSINPDYLMATEAYSIHPKKEIMTNLVAWLKYNKFSFLSDTQLTDSGEACWNKLVKGGMAKIINIETGEKYELHNSPVNPIDDNISDTAFSKNNTAGQRWFYIVEGTHTTVNQLTESCSQRITILFKRWYG